MNWLWLIFVVVFGWILALILALEVNKNSISIKQESTENLTKLCQNRLKGHLFQDKSGDFYCVYHDAEDNIIKRFYFR